METRYQFYLGAGVSGNFFAVEDFSDYIMLSLTAACYFKFNRHFGMGIGCSFGFPFEKITFFDDEIYPVMVVPRITFGWKL